MLSPPSFPPCHETPLRWFAPLQDDPSLKED